MTARPNRWRSLWAPILLATVASGCGESTAYKLAPVSGVVTLDGAPVPYTKVIFQPQATGGNINVGPASVATCDETGRFELKTIRGECRRRRGRACRAPSRRRVRRSSPRATTSVGPPPKEAFPAAIQRREHAEVHRDRGRDDDRGLQTDDEAAVNRRHKSHRLRRWPLSLAALQPSRRCLTLTHPSSLPSRGGSTEHGRPKSRPCEGATPRAANGEGRRPVQAFDRASSSPGSPPRRAKIEHKTPP